MHQLTSGSVSYASMWPACENSAHVALPLLAIELYNCRICSGGSISSCKGPHAATELPCKAYEHAGLGTDLQQSLHLAGAVLRHLLPTDVVEHFRWHKPCCLDALRCVQWLTRSEDRSSTGSCRSLYICWPLRHLLRIRKLKGRPGPRKGRSSGMTCIWTSELTAQTFCGSS